MLVSKAYVFQESFNKFPQEYPQTNRTRMFRKHFRILFVDIFSAVRDVLKKTAWRILDEFLVEFLLTVFERIQRVVLIAISTKYLGIRSSLVFCKHCEGTY